MLEARAASARAAVAAGAPRAGGDRARGGRARRGGHRDLPSLRSFLIDRVDRSLDDSAALRRAAARGSGRRARAAAPRRPGCLRPDRARATGPPFWRRSRAGPLGEHAPARRALPATIAPPAGADGPDGVRYLTSRRGRAAGATGCAPRSSGRTRARSWRPRSTTSTRRSRRLLLIELLVTAPSSPRSPSSASGSSGSGCGRSTRSARPPRRSLPATSHGASSAPRMRTEVGRLGLALNAMLAPIESAFRRARGVRAAAAPVRRRRLARAADAEQY